VPPSSPCICSSKPTPPGNTLMFNNRTAVSRSLNKSQDSGGITNCKSPCLDHMLLYTDNGAAQLCKACDTTIQNQTCRAMYLHHFQYRSGNAAGWLLMMQSDEGSAHCRA
jgi:predicted sulfurtransferase